MEYVPHPNKIDPGFLGVSIATCVLTLIALICVAIRFLQRLKTLDLGWDDWTVFFALVVAIGLVIVTILIAIPSYGASGYHINQYTVDELNRWFKLCLAGEVLYNFSISSSKISVLLFYRRIFSVDGVYLWCMRTLIFLVAGSGLASVFGLIFTTNPVQAQWNVLMPHTSINAYLFYLITAGINIAIDVAIYGLIQHQMWNLHADVKRKILLSFLLVLGAFSIIASILRLAYLVHTDFKDVTYTITTSWLWTSVEAILYIICACLPTVYSFFRSIYVKKRRNGTSQYPRNPAIQTIGSSNPSKFSSKGIEPTWNDYDTSRILPRSTYQVITETGDDTMDNHMLQPLQPIQVRREFHVDST